MNLKGTHADKFLFNGLMENEKNENEKNGLMENERGKKGRKKNVILVDNHTMLYI